MKTSRHFKLLENMTEIENWIKQQAKSCTRRITMIQVHHTYQPGYVNWPENELQRQENMRDFHISRKFGNIAQHMTIFPNGKAATGRPLDRIPCGIKGGNTRAICIEIYGDFDKGKDTMTSAQRKAVIAIYALFCKYFKIKVNTTGVRPHCWYTAGGTYLGDYNYARSAKSCPGTAFMGFGNTKRAFVNNFYPLITNQMKGITGETILPQVVKVNIPDYIAVTTDELNVRTGDTTKYSKITTLEKGERITVTHTNSAQTWVFIQTSSGKTGWVNKNYIKKVKDVVEKENSYLIMINTESLNIRKGPGVKYDKVGSVGQGTVLTIVDEENGWGLLKAYADQRNGWINLSYTKRR